MQLAPVTLYSTLSCLFEQKERDQAEVSTSRGGTWASCVQCTFQNTAHTQKNVNTLVHTHICMYIYMYMCVDMNI